MSLLQKLNERIAEDPELRERVLRAAGKAEPHALQDKIPQALVLYMGPALNEKDFTCGGCTFATPDGECALLTPSEIDLEKGACGLYVPGEPHEQDLMETVPQKTAGYVEEGPYTCGRCIHFMPPSSCEGVAGKVDAKGCCNAWEGE